MVASINYKLENTDVSHSILPHFIAIVSEVENKKIILINLRNDFIARAYEKVE